MLKGKNNFQNQVLNFFPSQKVLASLLKVSPSAISQLKKRPMSVQMAYKICKLTKGKWQVDSLIKKWNPLLDKQN